MTERLPDVWATRDFPVLREIVRQFDEDPGGYVTADAIAAALPHIDEDDIQRAGLNLARAGLIDIGTNMGALFADVEEISERALRLTGAWPDDNAAADALMWILEQKVAEAVTPEEKSKWRTIRDAFGSAGRDFAVDLAAALAARTLGA